MQKALLFILCIRVLTVSAQRIEGTIYDDEGNVLPFSSVLIKGTQKGVTANANGNFNFDLPPGNYTLQCMHVGYSVREKSVTLSSKNVTIDFTLPLQKLTLEEVVIKNNGEDPAYAIIRKAIKKRSFYNEQVKAYEAQIYIKGNIKVKNLPQKVLGQKIPEEDRKNMRLDSSGKGIIYLSESVTKISMQQPDKVKLEVISGRESGSNGFGFNFPAIISFYENNVSMFASQLNSRGYVSPIADNALNFYRYKLMGSFFEDGKKVNVIKVIPKKDYEPVFAGVINITENDWRIYSCDLFLTKRSQLRVLDSIEISQIHVPVTNDIWRIKSQVLNFSFNKLGIDAGGDFVNVYSKYNLEPNFSKKYFDKIILKYDTAVSDKEKAYWDSIRPMPLEPDEIKDYHVKDSIYEASKDSSFANIDYLRKKEGKLKLLQLAWLGVDRTIYTKKNQYHLIVYPLLKVIQYNSVEGLAINPAGAISKYVSGLKSNVTLVTDLRYGFDNNHFNAWGGLRFSKGRAGDEGSFNERSFYIAGGKRVSQFFKESVLGGLGNTISTLLYGHNRMKIYENYFGKAGYSKQFESGVKFLIEGEYEDRLPLNRTIKFTLNDKYLDRLTPNYPTEILSEQFTHHQAVLLHSSVSFTPGQKYAQFPNTLISLGSKYPTFTLDYEKGLKNIFGSDVDFDKWLFTVDDEANLKLAGFLKYQFRLGGFLNTNSVYIQDYHHFYGNLSHVAKEYVQTFQLASYYGFSNTSAFFGELHLEHHFNGMLTNKIPLLKKLNWNLVDGTNALYINPNTQYAEVFLGLENIFKLFRIDVVGGFQNGYKPIYTFRVGFAGLFGSTINATRFDKRKKVINDW